MDFLLVQIRFIQLKREAAALGIIYSMLLFLIFIFGAFIFFSLFATMKTAIMACAAFSLLLFSVHAMRMDKRFVNMHLAKPYQLMVAEYLVFTLPFTLPVLLSHCWYLFFVLIIIISITPLSGISVKQHTALLFPARIISINNFEWISGFRKNYLAYTIIYLLAFAFGWVKIFPLFLIWLLTASASSFYIECEPLQVLLAHQQNAAAFLKKKMIAHSRILLLFILPVALINFIFNPGYWWVILLLLTVQLAILNFAILFKYSVYEPSQKINANAVINSIVAISGLIPFLLPLPLLMCFRNYFIAKRNLQNYLHD